MFTGSVVAVDGQVQAAPMTLGTGGSGTCITMGCLWHSFRVRAEHCRLPTSGRWLILGASFSQSVGACTFWLRATSLWMSTRGGL